MNNSLPLHTLPDRDSLTTELTQLISGILSAGIRQNGRASLAVSGGSTPLQLFDSLSQSDIAWQHVDICLVDERWVAPDAEDSNEHLVRSHLLRNRAASARFTGMKNEATTAGEGEKECAALLQKIHHPVDVLLLGMGGDGHTASLFPGAAKLSQATDSNSGKMCMGIAPLTAPHERMTLTLPAILAATHIILHITGKNKKEVLEKAAGEGPAEEMPIRFVLRNREHDDHFSIYWAE